MSRLEKIESTLPSDWYTDEAHYKRELDAIWYRGWVCVGRSEQIPRIGDYMVAGIGTQQVIVLRGSDDQPRAFHNTCRHRGALLCREDSGHFSNGRIICPYHTWTYALDGELLATPYRIDSQGFDRADYPLYRVHAGTWGGFVFVNLADEPSQSLEDFLGNEAEELSNWPLSELRSVQQDRKLLACNWKVFWENYNECYHCPRVHPELCRVVPIYRKGITGVSELPDWQPSDDPDADRTHVAPGLETWTLDGRSRLPPLPGLSESERQEGMRFTTLIGSLFVVGHPDYARSVRVVPHGPESTELIIDWFLLPGTADTHPAEVADMLELGRRVVEQDGRVCELNQAGLRCRAHRHGVLVGQEHYLWDFHCWVRDRLGVSAAGRG